MPSPPLSGSQRTFDVTRHDHPLIVPIGSPLEIWEKFKLAFATYEGKKPGKSSVRVRLVESGEIVPLDVGQIISVWPDQFHQSSNTAIDWKSLKTEADRLLKDIPSRRLNLDGFWAASMVLWKREKLDADSFQLAGYLFHPGAFDKAAKARIPYRGPVTTAERYAAAGVLAAESFRFKRCASKMAVPGDTEPLMLVGGGYRPLESSVVQSREVMSFCKAVKNRESGQEGSQVMSSEQQKQSSWDAVQWRMLHSMELLALGGGIEALSNNARLALKQLGEEVSAQGARKLLIRAGYWTADNIGGRPSTTMDEDDNKEKSKETEALERKAQLASPWPEDILNLAKQALAGATRRRQNYAKVMSPERVGRRGPHGRHDYRKSSFQFYCVDPAGSEFSDDAISFDPETGEVLISIADVQGVVGITSNPALHDVAQQRGEALYLPDGPLHLLPPPALQAASLSDKLPNECITVAVRFNDQGWVENSRVVLTLTPPVIRLTYDTVNELLSSSEGEIQPYYRQAAKELKTIMNAANRRRAYTQRKFSDGKVVSRVTRNKEGELEAISFQRTPAHLMVDELLAVYTEAARYLCGTKGVVLPLAAGTVRGKQDAPRFATGPLRRYVDILAQGQISAVLKGLKPLGKKQIAEKMTLVNWQKSTSQRLRNASKNKALLEAFASFCAAQTRRDGTEYATVRAVTTGTGTEVFLPDAGLSSYVSVERAPRSGLYLNPDETFMVNVLSVDPLRGTIKLRFQDPMVEQRVLESANAAFEE